MTRRTSVVGERSLRNRRSMFRNSVCSSEKLNFMAEFGPRFVSGAGDGRDQSFGPLPVIGAEAVPARDEGRAGIEHLVLRLPAREFGTERIPGELHQPHALDRRRAVGGLLDALQDAGKLGVGEVALG